MSGKDLRKLIDLDFVGSDWPACSSYIAIYFADCYGFGSNFDKLLVTFGSIGCNDKGLT